VTAFTIRRPSSSPATTNGAEQAPVAIDLAEQRPLERI
jgi:hypothetical protein